MKAARVLLISIMAVVLSSGWLMAAGERPAGGVSKKLSDFFESAPAGFGVDASGKNIAVTFCDNDHLKLSAYNDFDYLYIQAAIYDDDTGEGIIDISQGRQVADLSAIYFDLDADGKPTPGVDRHFSLNPLVGMDGLYYQTVLGNDCTSGLEEAKGGGGKIVYLQAGGPKKTRFDRYAIAMDELPGARKGFTIKFCFYASSEKPQFEVNSAGFNPYGPGFLNTGAEKYFCHSIPARLYHSYTFTD